jgi:hypothetical protein
MVTEGRKDLEKEEIIEKIEDFISWLMDDQSDTLPVQQGFIFDQRHHCRGVREEEKGAYLLEMKRHPIHWWATGGREE